MNPSFEDALQGDKYLLSLATYAITHGLMPIPTSVEDVSNFQLDVMRKFNQYKRLIRAGEVTLEELGDLVAAANGPFSALEMRRGESIDEVLDKASIIPPKELPKKSTNFENLLKTIFGDIGTENGGSKVAIIPYGNEPVDGYPPPVPSYPEEPTDKNASKDQQDQQNQQNQQNQAKKRNPRKKK